MNGGPLESLYPEEQQYKALLFHVLYTKTISTPILLSFIFNDPQRVMLDEYIDSYLIPDLKNFISIAPYPEMSVRFLIVQQAFELRSSRFEAFLEQTYHPSIHTPDLLQQSEFYKAKLIALNKLFNLELDFGAEQIYSLVFDKRISSPAVLALPVSDKKLHVANYLKASVFRSLDTLRNVIEAMPPSEEFKEAMAKLGTIKSAPRPKTSFSSSPHPSRSIFL